MIIDLIIVALSCLVAWVVSGLIVPTEVSRKLRPGIADLTPPTRAELSVPILPPPPPPPPPGRILRNTETGESFIPVSRFATGGPVRGGVTVWLNEYSDYRIPGPNRTIYSPFSPRDAAPGDLWHDTSEDGSVGFECVRYGTESEARAIVPTGCQHPNPAPVVLTTDEVVAAVCPDCLQPLPPSSVGSEWKP